MNVIEQLEQEEITRLGKTIPDFAPGDTVIVNVNVVEGERKRVQAYDCLLYTSDAADDMQCVDLGGRRII